ncbi:hotdog fold domain-containing protein [Hoyosella subflava]|uniref:hotdog fold domain-containing protein n=1 Tax=Hoyosella subflava TaxID=639313 RepID=UPI003898DC09
MNTSNQSSQSKAEPRALGLWRRFGGNRIGRLAFSAGVWAKAPYFVTVVPVVRSAEPGRVVMSSPKWPGVHNHIGTFHAIAMCNIAEAAMGVLMEVTVQPSHQWIPKGMAVDYLAKAPSSLTATATIEPIDFGTISDGTDVVVTVSITDKNGNEVVNARITTWVRPKN